jgi:hypothetical protein
VNLSSICLLATALVDVIQEFRLPHLGQGLKEPGTAIYERALCENGRHMEKECMFVEVKFDFQEVGKHDAVIFLGICREDHHIWGQGLVELLADGFDCTDIRMVEREGFQVLAPAGPRCPHFCPCLGCTAIIP